MKYTDLLFDMDGTINRSGDGIAMGFRVAMEKIGMPLPEDADFNFTIGPPLKWSFARLGVPDEINASAVEAYRDYYWDEGYLLSDPYDGVYDMLKALKAMGYRLHVATSKPGTVALRVLDHYSLTSTFEVIATADDIVRNSKAAVIAWALEQLDVPKEQVLMIGDRYHDVEGAKANGIDCLGVSYGYGSKEELLKAGADYIADSPAGITELLAE